MKVLYTLLSTLLIASCMSKETTSDDTTTVPVKEKELLFVGTYTDKEGHVDGQAEGIYALEFDPSTSKLSETNIKVNTTNPSYLYVDSENKMVYATNEKGGDEAMISAFSYNDEGMNLVNSVPAEGGAPCYITKVNDHLITANYVGGNFAVFDLKDNSGINKAKQVITNEGKGLTSRQTAPHAHMIIKNPHTNQIIGVDLGIDKLSFFDFNKEEGRLEKSSELSLEPGSGPRHLDFHPSEDIIYVLNELNGTIDIVKNVDGSYQSVQNITSTRNPNNIDAGCADIHVHPSGKYLFASNRGPFNTISQYKIDADGFLELYGEHTSNGEVPRSFTLDPSGQFMLVANQNSDNIAIFIFDEESGQLIDTGNDFKAPTPVCLKFE